MFELLVLVGGVAGVRRWLIVIFLRCHGCGMVDFDCQWFVMINVG